MRVLLTCAVTALLAAGCIQGSPQGDSLTYHHDDAHGVSCWTISGYAYVSCLPDSEVQR